MTFQIPTKKINLIGEDYTFLYPRKKNADKVRKHYYDLRFANKDKKDEDLANDAEVLLKLQDGLVQMIAYSAEFLREKDEDEALDVAFAFYANCSQEDKFKVNDLFELYDLDRKEQDVEVSTDEAATFQDTKKLSTTKSRRRKQS